MQVPPKAIRTPRILPLPGFPGRNVKKYGMMTPRETRAVDVRAQPEKASCKGKVLL